MAFIEMENSKGEAIRIPKSAVKVYQNLGFCLKGNLEDAKNEDATLDVDEDVEDTQDEEAVESVDEEGDFVNKIQKKPLASWNKEEVKRYASIFGVDLSGTKSANEAKERIKAFLKNAE